MIPVRRITAIALLTAGLLWSSLAAAMAQPAFPELSGRVVDDAGLLDSGQRISLTQKLADLEARTSDQLVIVTLPSLAGYDIADYGYQLGRHWAIGQKDKNNGALLIVAPNERKVRIEVGYGLEGTLTDALTRIIIETSILPHFRSGDMAAGIVAGTDDLIKVISGDAQEIEQRAIDTQQAGDEWLFALFVLLALVLFITPIILAIFDPTKASGSKRRGSGWSSGSSSSSGWSSGSGGGFSGGGGSFGGGGSSGSW